MNVEDANNFIINFLRYPQNEGYSIYGYDIYLPNVLKAYLSNIEKDKDNRELSRQISPEFYAAAWELCRRGILRPGVKIMGAQSTGFEDGYSITPFGKQWLDESNLDDHVPTEPGRFAEMLKPFENRFGSPFYERSQEAIRCYGAHAYLACCVMCGAAAESILLATAIAKSGDEVRILADYNRASGRSSLEKFLLGKVRDRLREEFQGYLTLLKYWRDQAGHGAASNIKDNEAYTSLALLLRFSLYVDQWWDELIATP
jgi:hypothetical protein